MQTISQTLAPDHLATVYSKTLVLGAGASLNYSAAWIAGSAARLSLEYTDKDQVWREWAAGTVQIATSGNNFSGRFTNYLPNFIRVRFKSTNTVDATDDQTAIVITSLEGEKEVPGAAEVGSEMIYSQTGAASVGFKRTSYVDLAAISANGAEFQTDINNVAAVNADAVKATLSQGTSGSLTTTGYALDAVLKINASGSSDGRLAPIRAAIYSDSAVSDTAGVDAVSYLQLENAGNATGGADVDDDASLIDIQGHTIGNDNMIEATGTAYALAEITHGLRIKIGSTNYWVLISSTQPKNT